MGLIINPGPLVGVTSRGLLRPLGVFSGCSPWGMRDSGTCGVLQGVKIPQSGDTFTPLGFGCCPQPEPPQRLRLEAALGKERKGAERSRKEPKGAAGCLFSRDSRARVPAAPAAMKKPRQDEGERRAPLRSELRGSREGWSGLGLSQPCPLPRQGSPEPRQCSDEPGPRGFSTLILQHPGMLLPAWPQVVINGENSFSWIRPLRPPVTCPLFLVSSKPERHIPERWV